MGGHLRHVICTMLAEDVKVCVKAFAGNHDSGIELDLGHGHVVCGVPLVP